MSHRLTLDQRLEILDAYTANQETLLAISRRLGVDVNTVLRVARRMGAGLRGQRGAWNNAEGRAIYEAYVGDRETLAQIGERFGITRERVRQIATRLGAPPRGRGWDSRRVLSRWVANASRDQAIAGRFLAGETAPRLAKEYGLSVNQVAAIVARLRAHRPRRGHGFSTLAFRLHCPCEICRAAVARRSQTAIASRKQRGLAPGDPRHGTENGYGNWGCRCPHCKLARKQHMYALEMERREHPELAPPSWRKARGLPPLPPRVRSKTRRPAPAPVRAEVAP
jgi:hypothetical protein